MSCHPLCTSNYSYLNYREDVITHLPLQQVLVDKSRVTRPARLTTLQNRYNDQCLKISAHNSELAWRRDWSFNLI